MTGAVIVFHDVSVARAMSLRMSYLAQHDFLTELPNRMLLNDRLTQAIALAHRHRTSLAVLFVDVDHFKHINDTLGHAIGDQLLKSIAQRLVGSVRSSDTVSRQGGDEFVILLSEVAHAEDAALSADKILAALSAPHRIEHQDLHVTVSVGIGVYPDDGTNAETLLKNADTALFQAKACGRSNHQFFQPDMNVRARKRAC
jgi:diguanylate cyclase (GGDEF)-like protein